MKEEVRQPARRRDAHRGLQVLPLHRLHLQRQEAVAAKIICLEETARRTDRASSPEHLKSAVVIACVMMSLNFMDKVLS